MTSTFDIVLLIISLKKKISVRAHSQKRSISLVTLYAFGVRKNLGAMERSQIDLYESDRNKSYRAKYRLERAFYSSNSTKHASRISKDRYKIRERIENRYEALLRPEDQPPMPSNHILKNKNTKMEMKKDTKPRCAEERSNYHLRNDDSEAAVNLELQQSPSGKLLSRNHFFANASNTSCINVNPFRQVISDLNPFRKLSADLNPFR